MPRNKYITAAQAQALKDMRALGKAGEIEEIVCDGGECWVGSRRTSWQVVNALLQLCLLRVDDDGSGCHHFGPNSETYRVLDDPNYEPGIIEHYRTGKNVVR